MRSAWYAGACALIAVQCAPSTLAATQGTSQGKNACRFLPGDPQWPSDKDWRKLNQTVGGRLIRGIPLAQPCHTPALDLDACVKIQQQWVSTEL